MACEQWFWVSPLGFTRELTAFVADTEVQKGIISRYAPKVTINRRVTPFRAGATTTQRRHDIRTLPFPLAAKAANVTALQTILADLSREMNAVAGEGILRYVGLDARVSELFCVQTALLDTVPWVGSDGTPAGQKCTLQFEADDPYWHAYVNDGGFGGSAPGSWFPGLPWALGGSSLLGDVTIESHSDVDVYPVWLINGPTDGDVTATVSRVDDLGNPFTETWHLIMPALVAGETVTVDTGSKTVTGPDGSNWFRYLTEYNLWGLEPGDNPISLEMSGATDVSSITYSYRDLLLAP